MTTREDSSHIVGQEMQTALFHGWYNVRALEPDGGDWAKEISGICARQYSRQKVERGGRVVERPAQVSAMAFEIAIRDVDMLLALLARLSPTSEEGS